MIRKEHDICQGFQQIYYNEPEMSKLWATYKCVLFEACEG